MNFVEVLKIKDLHGDRFDCRGVEMTWQGRPSEGGAAMKRTVAFSSVWCNGNETNILDCTTKNGKGFLLVTSVER